MAGTKALFAMFCFLSRLTVSETSRLVGCVNQPVNLEMPSVDENDVTVLTWTKIEPAPAEIIILYMPPTPPSPKPPYVGRVEYISGGSLIILNATLADQGTYKRDVTFNSQSPNENEVTLFTYDTIRANLSCEYNEHNGVNCSTPHPSINWTVSEHFNGKFNVCMTGEANACLASNVHSCIIIEGLKTETSWSVGKVVGILTGILLAVYLLSMIIALLLYKCCKQKLTPSCAKKWEEDKGCGHRCILGFTRFCTFSRFCLVLIGIITSTITLIVIHKTYTFTVTIPIITSVVLICILTVAWDYLYQLLVEHWFNGSRTVFKTHTEKLRRQNIENQKSQTKEWTTQF